MNDRKKALPILRSNGLHLIISGLHLCDSFPLVLGFTTTTRLTGKMLLVHLIDQKQINKTHFHHTEFIKSELKDNNPVERILYVAIATNLVFPQTERPLHQLLRLVDKRKTIRATTVHTRFIAEKLAPQILRAIGFVTIIKKFHCIPRPGGQSDVSFGTIISVKNNRVIATVVRSDITQHPLSISALLPGKSASGSDCIPRASNTKNVFPLSIIKTVRHSITNALLQQHSVVINKTINGAENSATPATTNVNLSSTRVETQINPVPIVNNLFISSSRFVRPAAKNFESVLLRAQRNMSLFTLDSLTLAAVSHTHIRNANEVYHRDDETHHRHILRDNFLTNSATVRHITIGGQENSREKASPLHRYESSMGTSAAVRNSVETSVANPQQRTSDQTIDLAALSDNVYRLLESRIKIERERRGILH